jgi:hypothetical protein
MKYFLKIVLVTMILIFHVTLSKAYIKNIQVADTCKPNDVWHFSSKSGQLILNRSPNDTLNEKEALEWKTVSFDIMYISAVDNSLVSCPQNGNIISQKLINTIRDSAKENIGVFIWNINSRNPLTGKIVTLPSGCITIPLKSPN